MAISWHVWLFVKGFFGTLEEIKWDFKHLRMKFVINGKKYVLRELKIVTAK